MNESLIVENLKVYFPVRASLWRTSANVVKAVNDISFVVKKGETLGLVGESGCGKSTLGKAIVRLIRPTSGRIIFEGTDLNSLPRSDLEVLRKRFQIIFQDPYSSLNPRMKIKEILREPFMIHRQCSKKESSKRVRDLLELVGLRPESADKFPHEFSGGQRQRIGIARAIALQPDFIVADEPVSALDVSIQAQILNLLKNLQVNFKLTYLFISHDLKVISHICDRVIVMYLGRIMEILSREDLVNPNFQKHPYTEALIAAAPRTHPKLKRAREPLQGDIPSPARPPTGCVFQTRCPEATDRCRNEAPQLRTNSSGTHSTACHLR